MKEYKITLTVSLPDDYDEKAIDQALADAIYDCDGEMIDVSEYKEIKGDY